jgi:cytochrome c556
MDAMTKFGKTISFLLVGMLAIVPAFSQSEEDLDKAMKTVGKTMGELRKANEANDAAGLKAGGKTLVDQFTIAAKFFASHKMADATEMNNKTLTAAKALADGSGTFASVGSTCKGCHDMYREKLADGSYKLKMSH